MAFLRFLLAAAALIAGCASPPPGAESAARVEAPQPKTGERWVYNQINPFNRTIVGFIEKQGLMK